MLRCAYIYIYFCRNYHQKHQYYKVKLHAVKDRLVDEVELRDEKIKQLENEVGALRQQIEKVRGKVERSLVLLVLGIWRKPT